MLDELSQVVGRIAGHLPAQHLAALSDALTKLPGPNSLRAADLRSVVPTHTFANDVDSLLSAWRSSATEFPGAALAMALAAASAARRDAPEVTIDPVWTGPSTSAVPVRLTRAVLLELIDSASSSLLLVSFAAYDVDDVVEALAKAADRGVKVQLVLEEASSGVLTFDAAGAFAPLREMVEFYVWPPEKRVQLDRGKASLHAKTFVADGDSALVTSANLTGRAIDDNIELGLLVRGGEIPSRLARHFGELIENGVLVRS